MNNNIKSEKMISYMKLLRFHYYSETDSFRDPIGYKLWEEIEEYLEFSSDDWYNGMDDYTDDEGGIES
jgi:hypothetical protein